MTEIEAKNAFVQTLIDYFRGSPQFTTLSVSYSINDYVNMKQLGINYDQLINLANNDDRDPYFVPKREYMRILNE